MSSRSEARQRAVRQRAIQNQIGRVQRRLAGLTQENDRLVRWRLASFVGGLLISAATLLSYGVWWWLAVSAVALAPFVVLVGLHRRVETAVHRLIIWQQIKETQLARMALDWDRLPAAQPLPPRFDHPFALDLDLVGDRSLHQLLDTAVSVEGSRRLRDWLLDTAPELAQIEKRQALVLELARLPLFRDKLQLNAALVAQNSTEKWPGQRLLDWLRRDESAAPVSRRVLGLLAVLALLNLVLLAGYLADSLPSIWAVSWLLYAAVSALNLRRVGPAFQESFALRDGLEQLRAIFDFLAGYRYGRNRHLEHLCEPFWQGGERPSQQIKQISRIAAAISLQKNPFVWLAINALIPWDLYFAYRLHQKKGELADLLPGWLDIWFELEALNSLANFSYLNPGFQLPVVTDQVGDLFQAVGLGHPLIAAGERVCNDVAIGQLGSLAIITGSNMAGKSSFLRTVGINLALALAGGPVCAQSLHTTLFRLCTSMRIADSVTDGFSYFYAEVQRLKALLDALTEEGTRPLFFLIDEIFRGTNNRERFLGSQAYVQALVNKRGVGLIATHDLDLAALADEQALVTNFHFRDDVRNGRMIFDYKLRAGPCPTTNALEIMRLAGLPSPDVD